MKTIAKRVAAMVLMAGISTGAAAAYNSGTAVRYIEPVIEADDTVLTINGDDIGTQEYATYMLYNMRYFQDMYGSFGMSDIWDDPETASVMGASIPDAAKELATYSHVVLQKMKENHLALSFQQQKDITNKRLQEIEQAGGEDAYLNWIGQYGFDSETYSNFMYVRQCYSALDEYFYGENGVDALTDEELLQEYHDNYIMAKHILIQTVDGSTGEQLRTDEEARKEAQAILERLKAGEDFDELMNEYTEDPGIKSYPDGYIFTEGMMVDSFYEGALALQENELSELVESEFGYHIIMRLPLDDSKAGDYRKDISSKLGRSMENLMNEWLEEADVQTTSLYDEITYINAHNYSSVGDLAIQPTANRPSKTDDSSEDEGGLTDEEDDEENENITGEEEPVDEEAPENEQELLPTETDPAVTDPETVTYTDGLKAVG